MNEMGKYCDTPGRGHKARAQGARAEDTLSRDLWFVFLFQIPLLRTNPSPNKRKEEENHISDPLRHAFVCREPRRLSRKHPDTRFRYASPALRHQALRPR
jgi:hypothetical protein